MKRKKQNLTNILITGGEGYIGSLLIEKLLKTKKFKVLSIDIKEGKLPKTENYSFEKLDIRDKNLQNIITKFKPKKVVHLAFIVNPMHNEALMHDINYNGTFNLFKALESIKINFLLVASSGTAYGAYPDNPPYIKEDYWIRPHPRFLYARDKGLIELLTRNFKERNPKVKVAIIRPAIVYGPNVDNYLIRFLTKLPIVPIIKEHNPELQFVYEEDVAEAIFRIIDKEKEGAFNIATEDGIPFHEVVKIAKRKHIKLSKKAFEILVGIGWKLHLPFIETPPSISDYIAYNWSLDITRMKKELKLKPKTSRETLEITFKSKGVIKS